MVFLIYSVNLACSGQATENVALKLSNRRMNGTTSAARSLNQVSLLFPLEVILEKVGAGSFRG